MNTHRHSKSTIMQHNRTHILPSDMESGSPRRSCASRERYALSFLVDNGGVRSALDCASGLCASGCAAGEVFGARSLGRKSSGTQRPRKTIGKLALSVLPASGVPSASDASVPGGPSAKPSMADSDVAVVPAMRLDRTSSSLISPSLRPRPSGAAQLACPSEYIETRQTTWRAPYARFASKLGVGGVISLASSTRILSARRAPAHEKIRNGHSLPL